MESQFNYCLVNSRELIDKMQTILKEIVLTNIINNNYQFEEYHLISNHDTNYHSPHAMTKFEKNNTKELIDKIKEKLNYIILDDGCRIHMYLIVEQMKSEYNNSKSSLDIVKTYNRFLENYNYLVYKLFGDSCGCESSFPFQIIFDYNLI